MPSRFVNVNGFDISASEHLDPRVRSLVSRRRELLGPGLKLFYEQPLELASGEGVRVRDRAGREYLDVYNNVPCVGHCHPRVVEAIAQQAGRLNTNTRYLDESVIAYAEALTKTHGDGLDSVTFTCTGSEAVDLSLRVARHVTGANGVVVSANAYHGVTTAAAAISPSIGAPGPGVRTIHAPVHAQGDADDVGEALAAAVAHAIAELQAEGAGFAAFVADTILASDGLAPGPAGFLRPVADVVRAAGGLFVADEVQAGFGRTGETMWGYQRHGITPDLVPMGKPMGNGMPISGVVARRELIHRFGLDVGYFNTFAANSVSIAAAAAVLSVIEDENLLAHVKRVGLELERQLRQLEAESEHLGAVRTVGLYAMVDVVDERSAPNPKLASRIVNDLRARGVLISFTGSDTSTLKIRPPLPFASADVEILMRELRAVLPQDAALR